MPDIVRTIDRRRLKVVIFALAKAYGKQVRSVSDMPRSEILNRWFREDDRPVSDAEVAEETAGLIHALMAEKARLLDELPAAAEEIEACESLLAKFARAAFHAPKSQA
jgi:hypothetical protein